MQVPWLKETREKGNPCAWPAVGSDEAKDLVQCLLFKDADLSLIYNIS